MKQLGCQLASKRERKASIDGQCVVLASSAWFRLAGHEHRSFLQSTGHWCGTMRTEPPVPEAENAH